MTRILDGEVRAPIFKAISAWGLTLLTSAWQTWQSFPWSTLAQFLAAMYSALLIYEILIKKYRKSKDKDGPEQNLN